MSPNLKAYLQLSASMAIVGSSVVVGKILLASFPVFLASGLRFAIASAILVPLMFRLEAGFSGIRRRDWIILVIQAFTGVFLFSAFLLYGLKLTTAAESGIITSTTPAVTGLISFLFLRDRLTWSKGAGIGLAVLGVLAINLVGMAQGVERGPNPWLGNLLIFGAVVGEALFTILGKMVSERISPLGISTVMSLLGFLMFLPPSLYEAARFDFGAVAAGQWLLIAYYGVVVTVGAFMLWYQGMERVDASTAGVFIGVLPVSTLLFSYLILKEPFAWTHLVGVGCVLGGIGLMAWGEREGQD